MAVITLTTEWRPDDYYTGMVRGILESLLPGVRVIENACSIPPLNIAHAAFVIRNTFQHYPTGSIHLIFVHTEAGGRSQPLLVGSQGHWFVGADNGVFSLALNADPGMIYTLTRKDGEDDIMLFARVAAAIAGGTGASELGEPGGKPREMMPLRATIDSGAINGSVIFIDSYGNAVTNITRETFSRVFEGKPFLIYIQNNRHRIGRISTNYNDVPVSELLARFNHLDLLEVAINGANVSELFSLEAGSVVRIASLQETSGGTGLFT